MEKILIALMMLGCLVTILHILTNVGIYLLSKRIDRILPPEEQLTEEQLKDITDMIFIESVLVKKFKEYLNDVTDILDTSGKKSAEQYTNGFFVALLKEIVDNHEKSTK